MSGTSLDGVDVVLVDFESFPGSLIKTNFLPYNDELKAKLLFLHHSGNDELNKAALMGNQLAHLYAKAVTELFQDNPQKLKDVAAIGCHGQTIRHCPENGKRYTIQLGNAALLAELTRTTVIADFRSRDIAAGGQGAPLVPAFHKAMFMDSHHQRIIVNIGGIANITHLDPQEVVSGFDCGPGNLLMDAWCAHHLGRPFDKNGQWAASGRVIPALLDRFLATDFSQRHPPKAPEEICSISGGWKIICKVMSRRKMCSVHYCNLLLNQSFQLSINTILRLMKYFYVVEARIIPY